MFKGKGVNAMTLTVLMTVYNGGSYLRQAVESVLIQSYSDFEFLIVNDSSTDGSLALLRSFQDPRIRIIVNEVNCGQTVSLNIGLQAAKGEYIARIDADDVALPTWLESQMVVVRHSLAGCAVFSCWVTAINEKGLIKQLLQIPLTHEGMMLRALTASPVNHGGCLMKRDIILRYGGYDANFRILADYDLWARLLEGGERFVSGKDVLMAVRFHSESVSRVEKYLAVAREVEQVFHHYIKFLSANNLSEPECSLLRELCYRGEEMSIENMAKALIILNKIYVGVALKNSDFPDVMIHRKEREKILLVKKIFVCLLTGNSEGVRAVCALFEAQCGSSRMMRFFWCASYAGILGRLIPGFYSMLNCMKAVVLVRCIRLRGRFECL